ncbi:MAG TPA: TadE family protein [Verrucomicrobiae bacterium]|nr:TadE family protein [Verrucomicrobiae bacterium]
MRFLHKWMTRGRNQSGQALVEFMFVAFIVLFLLFGMIDFCRSISTHQVIINLSREGANLAARGSVAGSTDAAISNAIAGVIAEAAPLNINSSGEVIISAVYNTGKNYVITNQVAEGALTVPSKLGKLNNTITMPSVGGATTANAVPQSNQTTFVAEVFYNFRPATPLGNVLVGGLRGFTVTNQLYDAAYF